MEKQCISKDKLCDGNQDCKDGADEKDACCESLSLFLLPPCLRRVSCVSLSSSFLFHLLTHAILLASHSLLFSAAVAAFTLLPLLLLPQPPSRSPACLCQ